MVQITNKCAFCEVKTDKKQKVFAGKYIKILQARTPITDIHLLLIPLRHVESVDKMTSKEIQEIFQLIKKIATALMSKKSITGYNIFVNNGEKAGQHIPHIHFHFLARDVNENVSPFKVLSNRKLYEMRKINAGELSRRVSNMRVRVKNIFKKTCS